MEKGIAHFAIRILSAGDAKWQVGSKAEKASK